MKFDVILSNPPYQVANSSQKKRDSAANLWPQFVKKILETTNPGGVFSVITPTGWLSPSADIGKGKTGFKITEMFTDLQTTTLNINECKKHFPNVGSTFSYYIVLNKPNTEPTKIITEIETFYINLSKIKVYPSVFTKLHVSINNKVLKGNPLGFTNNNTSEGIKFTKDYTKTRDTKHKIKCLHSSAKAGTYVYSSYLSEEIKKQKVLVCSSGTYLPIYDNGKLGFTNKMYVYYLKENETLFNVKTYIESKLVKAILKFNKSSGWVSYAFRLLPEIDLSRPWTDKELYKHFNLTQEEIDLIEKTVK